METELSQVAFAEAFSGVPNFDSGDRALVGSRWCPEWVAAKVDGQWVDTEPLSEAQACFEQSASGGGSLDMEGCLLVEAAGGAALELDASACSTPDWQDDRFVIQGVDVAGLDARWWLYPSMVFDPPSRDGSGGGSAFEGLPPDYREPSPDEPLAVLAESSQFLFHTLSDAGGIVGWPSDAQTMEGVPTGAELSQVGLLFELAEGESMTPTLNLPQGQLVFPEVVGRALPDDGQLELLSVGAEDDAMGLGLVRDAESRIVFGVPIEVEVPAPYLLSEANEDEEVLYRGWFGIDDGCFEPGDAPIPHEVEVSARVAGLEATRVFRWTTPARDAGESAEPWEAPEDCEEVVPYADSGCSCRSGGGAGGIAAWLLLVPAFLRRRRRRP